MEHNTPAARTRLATTEDAQLAVANGAPRWYLRRTMVAVATTHFRPRDPAKKESFH